MLERRYTSLKGEFVGLIAKLAVEVNASFTAIDTRTRVETPLSLRAVLERIPAGLRVYDDRRGPAPSLVGGVRAPPHRPLRPRPLRDRLVGRRPQGPKGPGLRLK